MKKTIVLITLILGTVISFAQNNAGPRKKMAIFTPLYLDDAFSVDGNYLFGSKSFPKNSIQGLEFYHGAAIAIDSLKKLGLQMDVHIYDSKSEKFSLEQQFNRAADEGVQLIIANASIAELTQLSKLSYKKKITVINANVPNDANAENNPYFVVINATLQSQVTQLYNHIKTAYAKKPVIFITKEGNAESLIKNVFEGVHKTQSPQTVKLQNIKAGEDSLKINDVKNALSTNPGAVIVIGSLDTRFSTAALKQLSALVKTYPSLTVFGMPTWENITFGKNDFKGLEIVYSTPFYHPKTDVTSKNIISYYNKNMFARPSDLVYRAYSLTYKFGRLLNDHGDQLSTNLNSKDYKTFYDLDIQPVFYNNQLNYFENKKVYFLKYLNGTLKQVN